ncbi:proton-conducting membrane transporter [Tessaracoccus sp. OS52]|uniref:NADH-quinone oxidoreductase subunit B n=1 Tax=Tessaracoccus sp. OS52 TaxID=2886691 RepID=UPI001D129096|nr:proton-conducting membrane transporter [Tessaracoccus sp. OS52]MCC2592163.1 proton-conducting membrane transporter [Tessaracoccus sp. OS52]
MLAVKDWFGDSSVYVLDVPLACCAIESQSAAGLVPEVEVPPGAKLVVALSGTITHAVAPAVRELISSLPSKPVVVSFGSCACVGGPYWDSYSVAKGATDVGIEVDRFIAGCPPPPEALTAVLEEVRIG